MNRKTPHLYFHSNLDDPEQWHQALIKLIGPIQFSIGSECLSPETVDIALLWTTPPKGLGEFTGLKAVLSLGAGINQLDLATLASGVPVARLVDRSLTSTMVEYARAAVYRYHRAFDQYEIDTRDHRWSFKPPVLAAERTVGILGLGELGHAIGSALRSDGFRVLGWSRSEKEISGIDSYWAEDGLSDLVSKVDILVNVLPLTESTQGILNQKLFSKATRPFQIINIGRGGHLVEEDLVSALHDGVVIGATLDVAQIEPLPETSKLWGHPRVLITPHVAGLSSPQSAAANIAENIRLAFAGKKLVNQVDLDLGY